MSEDRQSQHPQSRRKQGSPLIFSFECGRTRDDIGQLRHDHESGARLTGRDVLVATAVGLTVAAGWLWYDWTRGALNVDVFVAGVLFLASVLVGLRCLDLAIATLASRYRLRRRLERLDREASDLHRRLEQIERP